MAMATATFGAGCFWAWRSASQAQGRDGDGGRLHGRGGPPTRRTKTSAPGGRDTRRCCRSSTTRRRSPTTSCWLFWGSHNPTTPNRQGPDVGTQYRSRSSIHTPEQRRAAEAMKEAAGVREVPAAGRHRDRPGGAVLAGPRSTTSATSRRWEGQSPSTGPLPLARAGRGPILPLASLDAPAARPGNDAWRCFSFGTPSSAAATCPGTDPRPCAGRPSLAVFRPGPDGSPPSRRLPAPPHAPQPRHGAGGRLACPYHGWTFDADGSGESPGTPKTRTPAPRATIAGRPTASSGSRPAERTRAACRRSTTPATSRSGYGPPHLASRSR